MKIAIVYGSSAPVPPVRGIAPGIVIFNTVNHLKLDAEDELVVFSRWEAALDSLEYDRRIFRNIKAPTVLRLAVRLIRKLPYRVYHPLLSAWFGHTDEDWLAYVLGLLFQVRAFRPDVIVCHVSYHLPVLLRRVCPRARILYYHHGSNMHLRLSEAGWRSFQRNLDGLVSVSQAAFDGIERTYGLIRLPHWVIHNGVDDSLFHRGLKRKNGGRVRARFGADHGDFIFLYAGRISPGKGIHHLIRAFIALADKYPRSRLWIVGSAAAENRSDFGYEESLHAQATALPGRITFMGWFPNAGMPELLASANVTILPALTEEGIPLSLLESMACATPVIATRIGGIPEIVQHEETGLLVSIENLESDLRMAMERTMLDLEFWSACSSRGAEWVRENHTYCSVAGQFKLILNSFRGSVS